MDRRMVKEAMESPSPRSGLFPQREEGLSWEEEVDRGNEKEGRGDRMDWRMVREPMELPFPRSGLFPQREEELKKTSIVGTRKMEIEVVGCSKKILPTQIFSVHAFALAVCFNFFHRTGPPLRSSLGGLSEAKRNAAQIGKCFTSVRSSY